MSRVIKVAVWCTSSLIFINVTTFYHGSASKGHLLQIRWNFEGCTKLISSSFVGIFALDYIPILTSIFVTYFCYVVTLVLDTFPLLTYFGSFCRYRKALYFWSLGISLYLELFCFLSFITFVLRNLCSGTHRRHPYFLPGFSDHKIWLRWRRKKQPKSTITWWVFLQW